MNTLQELLRSLKTLKKDIDYVVKSSKYDEYDDLSGLSIDYDNADQRFLKDELCGIMASLEKSSSSIEYLLRPIAGEYVLHKNERGRYECPAMEFTSGYRIECYVYDDFDERFTWVHTSVEHNGNDYYLVGYKDISLEGLKIRLRE